VVEDEILFCTNADNFYRRDCWDATDERITDVLHFDWSWEKPKLTATDILDLWQAVNENHQSGYEHEFYAMPRRQ